MGQLNTLLAANLDNYSPSTKQYTVLGPVKAIERLARGDGWVAEKVVIRHLANGNDEHLHVLSRPIPKPQPPAPAPTKTAAAAIKVKEAISGKRNTPRS